MKRASRWLVGVPIVLAACAIDRVTFQPLGDMPPAEDCATTGDEDGNGMADCGDAACIDTPACRVVPIPSQVVDVTIRGEGRITARVNGEICDATCLAQLEAGTTVVLAVAATSGWWFRGWEDACSGRHECAVRAGDGLKVTAHLTAEPNRIFVSSVMVTGNFGGLSGGDNTCQELAANAGLEGTYRVVISTSQVDWKDRLVGARGWIRTDGEPVADTLPISGAGLYQIGVDEKRGAVTSKVWGIRNRSGMAVNNCGDWTSLVGRGEVSRPTRIRLFGSNTGAENCDTSQRIVCAQVDRNVPMMELPTRGRLAFVTIVDWSPTQGNGIVGADNLCRVEAQVAGKTGSFRALLASPGQSAISRFNISGPPWVRADGQPLLPTAADFTSRSDLDVSPALTAVRGVVDRLIALGAYDTSSLGNNPDTCNGWTDVVPELLAYGVAETTANSSISCGQSLPVLCLQE